MNQTTEETGKIIGIHTFRWYDNVPTHLEADMERHCAIPMAERGDEHRRKYLELFDAYQPYKTREEIHRNIVVTVGRSVIAQRLANVTTYTGIVNYGALGTSSTAVANADTQLGTEVFRKLVASASYTTNVAFVDFFYTAADTNGTYQEFGTFIDGSGSANTGQLFSHVLTGGWVKSSSQSMSVNTQYTQN